MPADPEDAGVDAPSVTRISGEFWRLVGIVNVGLLAASLGVMLIAFTDRIAAGAALVVLGSSTLAYGYRRYRGVRTWLADNR